MSALDTSALAAAMLPRPVPPEVAAVQRRLFLEAIEPIQKMKVCIYSLYLPTVIIDGEGRLVSAAYPEEMMKLISRLDEEIERIAAQWRLP